MTAPQQGDSLAQDISIVWNGKIVWSYYMIFYYNTFDYLLDPFCLPYFTVSLTDYIVDWFSLGERQNASELCKTNSMKPKGSVETSLPVLLIEHCDYSVCFHNGGNM